MGPGQRPAARRGVERHAFGHHHLDVDRALHVAQLSPVEAARDVGAGGPAEEDVAGRLHQPLALDDPLAGLPVTALRQVALEHRARRLLQLEEQRVLLVPALEECDEGTGPDAPHPDHLACDVDELEPLDQAAPVRTAASGCTPRAGSRCRSRRVLGERLRRSCAQSRSGTMNGGWLTIRYWPSTSSPSLARACVLSRASRLPGRSLGSLLLLLQDFGPCPCRRGR